MPIHIAVYGTLRSGEGNHRLVEDARSKTPCVIPGRLMNTGYGYPAIVLDPAAETVGEVIEITREMFARVDRLEGYPHLYTRERVRVRLASGGEKTAWVYVMNQLPDHATPIPSGDWKRR